MFVITPQLVFRVLGIAFLVIGAILVAVTVSYFFRQDIRGVMDDLAGRKRRGETSGSRRRPGRPAAQRRGGGASQTPRVDEEVVREAPGAVVQPSEDELDTVLDTKLRKVPQRMPGVNSDGRDVNDDTPTLVTALGDYHRSNVAESKLTDDDASTVVNGNEQDTPTEVEHRAAAPSSFTITRSIVAIHANEVITAG